MSLLCCITFPLQGKTNASSRSSRENFWRRCWGDLRQVKTYQVPIINSHVLHYIILHLSLVFLSPTSKMIFEKICLFFASLPFVFFACFLCARVLVCLLMAQPKNVDPHFRRLEEIENNVRSFMSLQFEHNNLFRNELKE